VESADPPMSKLAARGARPNRNRSLISKASRPPAVPEQNAATGQQRLSFCRTEWRSGVLEIAGSADRIANSSPLPKAQPTKDEKNDHDHADDVDDVVHSECLSDELVVETKVSIRSRLGKCPAELRASSNSGVRFRGRRARPCWFSNLERNTSHPHRNVVSRP
jgi:hypothetical protein